MIVQFSASESNISEDIFFYREIVKAIKNCECELAIDWIEEAYKNFKMIEKSKNDSRNWSAIHKKIIDAINRADICIFEASAKSFSIGFQTSLALNIQKPTLVLTRNDSLRNSFGSGIVSNLLVYKTYNENNLHRIISEFIYENNPKSYDLRFNFVIDREIHNYLKWAAFKSSTTKAEVVRKMIRSKIDEKH